MAEVAACVDLVQEKFCFLGCQLGWGKWETTRVKTEVVNCEDAEFCPNGFHTEFAEGGAELCFVDLVVVFVQEHCPVANLT